MIIRLETPSDIAAIHDLNTSAFGRDGEARLVDALRDHGNLPISLVAEDNGIVGHVGFSPMNYAVKSIGLAPLAVAKSHRKQGIGAALCKAGLEIARVQGYDLAFVLGSEKYYLRFGFRRSLDFGIKSPYPDTEEHFFVIEFRKGALQQAKGPLSYAPEFDGL